MGIVLRWRSSGRSAPARRRCPLDSDALSKCGSSTPGAAATVRRSRVLRCRSGGIARPSARL
eukprot:3773634-Alexandrium_andersonii.AAC.1